jgi:dTMP kinase
VPGHLISFEGLDGVGKTTQIELLRRSLLASGVEVRDYREPGGTELGERLRTILKAGIARGTYSELLLFATARAELVELHVQPDLAAGRTVLLDRFTDSTWAYQSARGIPDDMLRAANVLGAGLVQPELTFWLDLDPKQAAERRRGDTQLAQQRQTDSFEHRGEAYFANVRSRYAELAAANPQRIRRIDATQTVDAIAEKILSVTLALLKRETHTRLESIPA